MARVAPRGAPLNAAVSRPERRQSQMKAIPFALIALALMSEARGVMLAAGEEQSNPCTRPPVVLLAVAPGFPDLPWKARIGADQWVQVEVNEAGDVANAVLEAEMNPSLGFGNAAVVAARRWKFEA